jgi:tetratricopeptide (TPR) repeat protein
MSKSEQPGEITMATDGVKIIDGDLAYDTYGIFRQKYNEGASVTELKTMYEVNREEFRLLGGEYYEIYITVYALAFWEIGELTDEMLAEVKAVIELKAGVNDWTEQCGEKAGKARQIELDKLLVKISTPRKRIKKREIVQTTVCEDDERRIEAAETLKMHGKYDDAKAAYQALLAEEPDLHDARYKYVELLIEEPKNYADCPKYSFSGGVDHTKYRAYKDFIIEHTDWTDIERNCKYMLERRDTDKFELTNSKKLKVCDWFIFIITALKTALFAQGKCEEAIPVIQEWVRFNLSMKGHGIGFVLNDLGEIYMCYLSMNDLKKATQFKMNCKEEWTDDKIGMGYLEWEETFTLWDRMFTEDGIRGRI